MPATTAVFSRRRLLPITTRTHLIFFPVPRWPRPAAAQGATPRPPSLLSRRIPTRPTSWSTTRRCSISRRLSAPARRLSQRHRVWWRWNRTSSSRSRRSRIPSAWCEAAVIAATPAARSRRSKVREQPVPVCFFFVSERRYFKTRICDYGYWVITIKISESNVMLIRR